MNSINAEFKSKIEDLNKRLDEIYSEEYDICRDYYVKLNEWCNNMYEQHKPLVLKLDDTYIIYKRHDNSIWNRNSRRPLCNFNIMGFGFDEKDKIVTGKKIGVNTDVQVITHEEFIEKFNTFKKKKFNPDDENVRFQYEYHTPFYESEIIEMYPEYFKDEYINEFYDKLNKLDEEMSDF